MALVAYSDSEGSDDEQQPQISAPKQAASTTTKSTFNSLVDKSNPRKIRVNLSERSETKNHQLDGEPAPKKARIGGGAFSGFNSLLPPPKRTAQPPNGAATSASKGIPRKVFSLKTGTERGFDRAADAELKQMFADQEAEREQTSANSINGQMKEEHAPVASPTSTSEPVKPKQGNPMMFKPLSVARNPQKKKKPQVASAVPQFDATSKPSNIASISSTPAEATQPAPPPAKSKVSLFSMRSDEPAVATTSETTSQTDYEPLVYSSTTDSNDVGTTDSPTTTTQIPSTDNSPGPQTLETIARDLNLSASAQRQLFGRNGPSKTSSNEPNILHFSTDAEWSANEALRASGAAEENQHHQVKAIAPGKHSLKQLISSASGQIEALEESFAAGKRRKGEAGARYGW